MGFPYPFLPIAPPIDEIFFRTNSERERSEGDRNKVVSTETFTASDERPRSFDRTFTGLKPVSGSDIASRNVEKVNNSLTRGNIVVDNDGFQLVQRKRKRSYNRNIIGSKKAPGMSGLRGAVKTADLYLGNCDLSVTSEIIEDYVLKEMSIKIMKCESLKARDPNTTSFKLTLTLDDRLKLLNADVWPENIVCRKFYSFHKST